MAFTDFISLFRKLEREGRSKDALWYYLSAVEIQDSDVRLHKKILNLHNELESYTD